MVFNTMTPSVSLKPMSKNLSNWVKNKITSIFFWANWHLTNLLSCTILRTKSNRLHRWSVLSLLISTIMTLSILILSRGMLENLPITILSKLRWINILLNFWPSKVSCSSCGVFKVLLLSSWEKDKFGSEILSQMQLGTYRLLSEENVLSTTKTTAILLALSSTDSGWGCQLELIASIPLKNKKQENLLTCSDWVKENVSRWKS